MDSTTMTAALALEPAYDAAPAFSDADLERGRAAADVLRAGGDEAGSIGPDDLVALSPDQAGRLAADLATAGRVDELALVVSSTPPHRYPLVALLAAAAALPVDDARRSALIRAVALATPLRLRSALDEVGADPSLEEVMAEVATVRTELAAGPPYRWWGAPQMTMAEPPGDDEVVFRDAGAARKSYARLDVAGTERPDVVVVDQPFEVTLGLQSRKDGGLVASSPLVLQVGETVELDVVLLHDPTSIEVTGSPRARITVTDLAPFPAVTMTCTARYGEELARERRLGLQVLRDGQVVAVAWRTIVAVATSADVAGATVPERRDVTLLDLDPLLGEQPPDLVVSVCRADAGGTSFVWTAYAADPAVPVPDLPSTSTLDDDIAAFATETRRSIQFSADPGKDYLGLAGRARRIARAIPQGVQEALRAVVETPGRTSAPAVLLLTEELTIPWELASLDPDLTSSWGGTSPFLGAHAAVARWPLSEHKPRPRPQSTVSVRTGAVLTADYTGVSGWGRLENAVAEAGEVATLFDPPATPVAPEIWAVIDLFRGRPPADVLHVALHGQYDGQGDQEGIVLLAKSPAGGATAQFLTPAELENGELDHGPFVFLNACQVGADERVLGDYGGFASTLLRIGAVGVVAPLWNVKDDVAAAFARQFYAAALSAPEPVAVAEAVRALRATYTEEGVRAGTAGLHATLVAYQVFGHPRLRLTRSS